MSGNLFFTRLSHLTHPKFWNWFTLNTDVHEHATVRNTIITQKDYFDVGTVTFTTTLHPKKCNLESYGAKMIQVLGPDLWNSFPNELRNSDSISIFSKHLRLMQLESYN